MMIQNRKGNVFLLSLIVTVSILTSGLVLMTGFSQKADFISKYERKSGGRGRLEEEIKFIEAFRYDWLENQRTNAFSKEVINKCIPKATDLAPQDFSKCPLGTLLADSVNAELWGAYVKEKRNTLTTITASSRAVTLPLVDVGDRPIAGPQEAPALFDEAGLPCNTNCHYEVTGYMLKEKPNDFPGNLVFAFHIKDVGTLAGMVKKKDKWIFIPILVEHWNRMPLNLAWATNTCPSGSFAVGFLPNRKVICRDHEMECMDGQYLQGLDHNGNPICRQLPVFVEPAPSLTKLDCDSWGWAYNQCTYTLPDPNSTLSKMTVNYQRSRTTCISGKNFGYSEKPLYIWTNIGCRAAFNLEFLCNTDHFFDYGAKVCRLVEIGQYSPDKNNGAYSCTNGPAHSQYTGRGGGANACPWTCELGYDRVGDSCIIPPPTPTPTPTTTPSV